MLAMATPEAIARYEAVEWEEGDLADSARGAGGFGSSGR